MARHADTRRRVDFPRRFTATTIRREQVGEDDYGGPIYDTVRTDHPVVGWAQPGDTMTSDDTSVARQDHHLDLYADIGIATLNDRVEVMGRAYTVTKVRDYSHGPFATTDLGVYELKETT